MLAAALAAGIAVGAAAASRECSARGPSVFPFSGVFALISGSPAIRARRGLLLKSYLSALAVLLLVSTTPLPALLRVLRRYGVPRFLLMVTQFLYRYLFVISEEAQHMRTAAAARGRD